jgi:phosphatidylserine decarboxylase
VNNHTIFNRITGAEESEISGNTSALSFLYHSHTGKVLTAILSRRYISALYGRYVRSRRSKRLITSFIKQYKIHTAEIKNQVDSFKSLNDFFIRELRSSSRPVDPNPAHLISPADSRLFVFDMSKENAIPVKGYWYVLKDFIRDENLADEFAGGWCFVYRLAPCDYHRFCYVDSGKQDEVRRIKGLLHSVNPIALSSVDSLMARNYREMTIMYTDHFGKVLHFEVGALMVGKVVLHNRKHGSFSKGEEKGWFEFGGSTIVQFFKHDQIKPDADILLQTSNGLETLVRIGERIGAS